ncbi:Carotenogenesis protein CarS [Corallococcus sp. H22C18031201]|uniref:Carotenogenesis protein CarS n=1 Tax=Citreicoccus inhibens TaxID=2849499 RepID=UPI000E73210C|nr:Carotenogenesis protein CarS [Citreicoccus inhibens]MBU8894507.1 Carotenogenesis protein CarS [Citreicoccus inhibens]RJS25106.1 Carotenogenesis protein CarS [Corallococcus sp. H22C18031201]
MKHEHSLILNQDVDGAPVRMGATVKIVGATPDDPIARRFLGRLGTVTGLVYDDPARQFPADPLIQVRVRGLGEDLFFVEELELAPEWVRRNLAALRESARVARRERQARVP